MPRAAREKSESGIYHIMMRGTNRKEIFLDDEDNRRFLRTLNTCKKNDKIIIYGWCLMGNHVHLLLKEGEEGISKTIQRLGISYASFYNWKYHAVGHVFQDRFKSEKVETDEYLLTVIRYIHQNPVKAGMVIRPSGYKWSSCNGYYGKPYYPSGMLDETFMLEVFGDDKEKAVKRFIEFNEQENDDHCLEEIDKKRLTDKEALEEIKEIIKRYEPGEIKNLGKLEKGAILKKIKRIEGITLRQAARIIGISHVLIHKA